MKRLAALVVPAILLGILAVGSLAILLIVGPAKEGKLRAVAVLKTIDLNMEFWETVKEGMRTAAKDLNVNLEIVGPWTESDVEGQVRIAGEAIRSRPPVLILAATDYAALVPSVEEAAAAGVRVVTLDSGVDSPLPACFVATDNEEAGLKAGREMLRVLPPGASVAVVNHIRGATTAMQREAGTLRALEEDGSVSVVGVFYTNNFEERAYAIAREIVEAHPGIGGILAMNEVSTIGVARALVDLGLAGRIRLVGFDSSLVEVRFIEEGVIDATVIQKPFTMGYLAVATAKDVVAGKKVPRFIDTGSSLVTAENLYSPENQKILFPFSGD